MNFLVIAGCVVFLGLLRLRNPGTLAWAFAWWIALYVFVQYGFDVPVPGSVASIYMAIVTCSIAAYVTSSKGRLEGFTGPIVRLATDPSKKLLLLLVLVAVPSIAALNVWAKMNVPLEAPAFGRTIHPAPEEVITVHEREISLISADNPYRHYETDDPETFKEHVENGRRVYFQNCFYCHGDGLAGDGMFAHGLNPIPTNFTDQGIIPQLQESFLFWRIAKGGPGIPDEGGPWDTAMPVWEKFLTEEEMWDVVTFLSDFTGYTPRARSEHSDGAH